MVRVDVGIAPGTDAEFGAGDGIDEACGKDRDGKDERYGDGDGVDDVERNGDAGGDGKVHANGEVVGDGSESARSNPGSSLVDMMATMMWEENAVVVGCQIGQVPGRYDDGRLCKLPTTQCRNKSTRYRVK